MTEADANTDKRCETNVLLVQIQTTEQRAISVNEVDSKIWKNARDRMRDLMDDNVPHYEKRRIVEHLTNLLDKLERNLVLEAPNDENGEPLTWTVVHYEVEEPTQNVSPGRLADVNCRLISLGDKITGVKNKMLSNRQRYDHDGLADLQIARSVHRNFRRILQKESRFLRDELISMKDKIDRYEKKDCNGDSLVYHPVNFINIVGSIKPAYPLGCRMIEDSSI